jgi:hypothetical protein
MICRYFSPNPQEPTSKTTSVMTGGVEHDQGIHRQSLEKLLRLPFQTPPLLLHSQLLLSKSTFFDLQQSTHSSHRGCRDHSVPACYSIVLGDSPSATSQTISELNPSMPPRLCQLPVQLH